MNSRVEGADELLRDLRKLGNEMDAVEREMLKSGGQVMDEDGWRAEIEERDFISEQDKTHMVDAIGVKMVSRHGRLRAEITAFGEDVRVIRRGKNKGKTNTVRHAAKAFMLHYGTSRIKATRWIDSAEDRASNGVTAAMRSVLDAALTKTMGGK